MDTSNERNETKRNETVSRSVVIRGKNVSLDTLTPFQRKNAVDKLGHVGSCVLRRNGSLIVELGSVEESLHAQSISELTFSAREGGAKVEKRISVDIQPQQARSLSQGIISCRQLKGMSNVEICEGLEEAGVVEARRLGKTNAVVLSFSTATLPNHVYIGYLSVPVRTFVPDPLRCFRCHRFGHGSAACRSQARCGRCGEPEHGKECNAVEKCPNCNGNHSAWDRKCSEFLRESEIVSIKVSRNITFPEAKKVYEADRPAISYRDVAASQPRAVTSAPAAPPTSTVDSHKVASKSVNVSQTSITLNTKIRDLLDMTVGDILHLLLRLLPGGEIDPPGSGEPQTSASSALSPNVMCAAAALAEPSEPNLSHSEPSSNCVESSLVARPHPSPPFSHGQPNTEGSVNPMETVTADEPTPPNNQSPWIDVGKGGKPITPKAGQAKASNCPEVPTSAPTSLKDTESPISHRKRVEALKTAMDPPPLPPPPTRQSPRPSQGPAAIARPRPPNPRSRTPPCTSDRPRPDKRDLPGSPSPNSMESPRGKRRSQ